MTIKDASIRFSLEEKEIRNLYKPGIIIGAQKDRRCVALYAKI